jgi:hypothetical protein
VLAEHVLVDAAGGVRLCGFGTDDGTAPGDVHAFGILVRELLDPDDTSSAAAALRAVTVRCTVDDVASRPTMAAVTASLAHGRDRERTIRPTPAVEREHTRRRWPIGIAVAALTGVALIAFLPRGARADLPPVTTTTSEAVVATTTTTRVLPVRVWSAARIVHGAGAAWRFDGEGMTLLGDWDCDSVETPAVVRPDGSVWVIDAWPTGGEAAARWVTTVDDATGAHVDELASGCDDLVVETPDGPIRPALGAA